MVQTGTQTKSYPIGDIVIPTCDDLALAVEDAQLAQGL